MCAKSAGIVLERSKKLAEIAENEDLLSYKQYFCLVSLHQLSKFFCYVDWNNLEIKSMGDKNALCKG
jgi:hypothetical protein